MARKYDNVYVGLAELVMELGDRPTYEEKGRFIEEVVRCVIKQTRGINSYADSLMDQADEYREDNRRRQQEYRERQKGKTEEAQEQPEAPEAPQPEPAKPAKKTREKKKDAFDDPEKTAFGPFENVWLTDAEHGKLVEKYGDRWEHALNILSSYKKSSGKTYKCDFAAFFQWVDRRMAEEDAKAQAGGSKSFRQMDKEEAAQRVRESFPGVMEKFGL